MRRTRKIRWQLKALALGFAAAATFTGAASANVGTENQSTGSQDSSWSRMPAGYAPAVEAELALIRGEAQGTVTATNLAGAHAARYEGVASPDGFQPQLRGPGTLVIRDAPDGSQPQLRRTGDGTEYVTTVDPRAFDFGDAALGLMLGLILAAALAFGVGAGRSRIRMAHS